jgi:hypothetical protein
MTSPLRTVDILKEQRTQQDLRPASKGRRVKAMLVDSGGTLECVSQLPNLAKRY